MKNFETPYTVDGSTALKPKHAKNIIDFPSQDNGEDVSPDGKIGLLKSMKSRVMATAAVQDLLAGSIMGKPFNKAQAWQSILAGSCFFAFAIACIYFGR